VTGTPLFSTSSIIELVKKVTTEPVQFPKAAVLYPECQSFLDGLLQKDPRNRLSWPEILRHDFVRDKLDLHLTQTAMVPLTHPLSESQERRREEQRQDLEAKLQGQGQ
jgi:fused-like protein